MTDPTGTEQATEEEQSTEQGVRFEDAYWDDAFCAWWDPSMRVCC